MISSRQKIKILLSKTNGLITLSDLQENLGLSRFQSSQILYRLSKKGWINKLKNGLYRIVALESSDPTLTDENPWVIAHKLFSPSYIGGWTAANFWGLTDQLFLDTWIITSKKVFIKKKAVSGHHFILRQTDPSNFFGLKGEWIDGNKVLVSDLHKTVLDFLNFSDEFTAQTMFDILKAYLVSKDQNMDVFFQYAQKLKNRSTLKRLGFFLEILSPESESLIQFCFDHKSKGISPLSAASSCDNILSRWNLKVPQNLSASFKEIKND